MLTVQDLKNAHDAAVEAVSAFAHKQQERFSPRGREYFAWLAEPGRNWGTKGIAGLPIYMQDKTKRHYGPEDMLDTKPSLTGNAIQALGVGFFAASQYFAETAALYHIPRGDTLLARQAIALGIQTALSHLETCEPGLTAALIRMGYIASPQAVPHR